MKRLTDKNFKVGFNDIEKLPSYESIYEKLREYENAEEEKTNIHFKAKPGDCVWIVKLNYPIPKNIMKAKIHHILMCDDMMPLYVAQICENGTMRSFSDKLIGEKVFISEEEAIGAWNDNRK